jgi:hypothetical protein
VNYFYIVGPIAVAWALIVSLLGLTRRDFPGRALPAVVAISAVLFLGGIVSAATGAKHKSGERHGPPAGTPVAGHKNA